jgi:hypothetical protein
MNKEFEGKVCEFELDERKCTSTEIVGIARCRNLCKIHYDQVVKDNIRRFNKGESIPEKLIFTKKLFNSEAWSFLKRDL